MSGASAALAEQVLPHAVGALSDGDKNVRGRAVKTMGKLAGTRTALMEQALPHVVEALRDTDGWVRFQAKISLSKVTALSGVAAT